MQLIHAVRDDRSQEYVHDIREEMEKYKRRSQALDRFKFFLVEKKASAFIKEEKKEEKERTL